PENALEVWPNPVEDELQWSIPDLPAFRNPTDYQVTNVSGYAVRAGAIRPGERRVDVRGLPPGIYFLNLVKNGKIRGVRRFVKM
ncbi:MAG: T9SS type A sorting domain-containing protein, partial [Bacteroidota bacterium]